MKTKIVLDADVIIHFIKADQFSLLLDIFPEFEYLILDVVYDEVTVNHQTRLQIDNTLKFLHNRLKSVSFSPKGELKYEYAKLRSSFGKGESACMVYCKENNDVLGSSNLKDIKDYCIENNITYLTTLDFLYYAFIRKKMNKPEIEFFIETVIAKGSKLPQTDIETYIPNCVI